jgi:hypothetical protein
VPELLNCAIHILAIAPTACFCVPLFDSAASVAKTAPIFIVTGSIIAQAMNLRRLIFLSFRAWSYTSYSIFSPFESLARMFC